MKFILVGDHFPAIRTLKLLREFADAQVVMIFSSLQPDRLGELGALAEASGINLYSSDELRESVGLNR